MTQKTKQDSFVAISDLLKDFDKKEEGGDLSSRYPEDKYISREFQKYGYDLAEELNDLKNKSLYIKLAKREDRALLESVRSFVRDAENVKNPTALFLWKLNELKKNKVGKSKK